MSQPLRVAIVHYHFKRGGVTRVVESTIKGLSQLNADIEVKVFAGEIPESFAYPEQAVTVPALHYANTQSQPPSTETLYAELIEAARTAFGDLPDIWHLHNHSLGKNAALSGLVHRLAKDGAALLLQMHDFAEDGRPRNYQSLQSEPGVIKTLYPISDRIHYAVLNQRDHQNFLSTGLDPKQLHSLPNPVEADSAQAGPSSAQAIRDQYKAERLHLYPVRALRRKNFGEMLLWAACAQPGEVFANTLGPTNANYQAAYQDWQDCAEKHQLPVHFSIGEQSDYSFPELIDAASVILSTSIAEGFGMGFLEPWLFNKQLIGRDIPEISADFKAAGLQLDSLYSHIAIPEDWIDTRYLKATLYSELASTYQAYQTELPDDVVDLAYAAIQTADGLDFGGLDETLQKQVIAHVCCSESATAEIRSQLQRPDPGTEIQQMNREICLQKFGLQTYAEKLYTIYQTILAAPVSQPKALDPKAVLQAFLKPQNFRLLRT